MADTIREQIIAKILTRIGTIATAAGYNTNIGATVERVRQTFDPDELPASSIWPMAETSTREYGTVVNKMPIRVEGLMAFGATNPSVVHELILGDIITAMTSGTDPTDGLADDIIYITGGTDSYPEEGHEVVGCPVVFNIVYAISKGDPYSQPS